MKKFLYINKYLIEHYSYKFDFNILAHFEIQTIKIDNHYSFSAIKITKEELLILKLKHTNLILMLGVDDKNSLLYDYPSNSADNILETLIGFRK